MGFLRTKLWIQQKGIGRQEFSELAKASPAPLEEQKVVLYSNVHRQ